MRLVPSALVLALAALPFATGCMRATGGDSEDVGQNEEAIINGSPATAYPEAALVDLYQGGQLVGYCSGSVIAPDVVLTAGHCTYGFNSWHIRAPYANNQTATASAGTTYDWTNTSETVDPNQHDIGLIFLNSQITLSAYPTIASSKLPSGSQVVNIGRIRNGQLSTSNLYVSGNVTVHDGAQFGYPYDYEAQNVIESGDSGGPDEASGTHTIVAVNSGGGGDEVLARTDLLYDWIQSQIQNHGGTGATTGAGVTTGTGAGQTCDDCQADAQNGACNGAVVACENNPDCINLNNCLANCQDQACYDQCTSAYPNGVNDLNGYISCICDNACVTPCAVECGNSSSSSSASSGATTTGVGVGVGVGATSGAGAGLPTGAGAGAGGPSGAGGAGGGFGFRNDDVADDGGCAFGTGSDSAAWGASLVGIAIAIAARRRRRG